MGQLFAGADTIDEIKADIAALKTIADVVEKTKLAKPKDFADALALLTAIDDAAQAPKVLAAFKDLGLEAEYAAVAGLIAKAKALGEKIPDWVKTLLKGVDQFGEGDAGELSWEPVKGEKKLPLGDGFSLGLKGGIAIGCAASVPWDKVVAPARLMRVSAHGDVGADAAGEIPYSLGKVKAGASAGLALDLAYYFDAAAGAQPYVAALARRIVHAPSPFDYAGIWEAARAGAGFRGLDYVFAANAGANFAVSLGYLVDKGDALKFNLDASVSLAATYARGFKLAVMVRGEGDAATLHVRLNRTRLSAVTIGASLNVAIDSPRLRAKVQDIIKTKLAIWDEKVPEIEKILSPGTFLRGKAEGAAKDALDGLVGDTGLRAAIQRHIDTVLTGEDAGGTSVIGWLQDAVRGAIDRHSAKLIAEGQDAVANVTGEVLDDLSPYLPADISDAAKAQVAQLVALAKAELEGATTALWNRLGTEAGGAEKALKALLDKAGAGVSGAVTSADDALKGVRALLTKYNDAIHDIAAKAQAAAEKKVTLAVTYSNKRSSEITLNVEGDFADPGKGAEVFGWLTRGKLSTIRVHWETLAGDPGDGFAFDPDLTKSSFVEAEAFEETFGFELMVLGFGGTYSDRVTADARAALDAAGNVQIDASAALARRFGSGSVQREVSFGDVLSFAAARQAATSGNEALVSRAFKLGADIGYQDASYSVAELEGFLGSLESAAVRLISREDGTQARAAFATLLDGGEAANAAINAAMWIGTASGVGQLEALLMLGDANRNSDGTLRRDAIRALYAAAIDAVVLVGEEEADKVANALKRIINDQIATGNIQGKLPAETADRLMLFRAMVGEGNDKQRFVDWLRDQAQQGHGHGPTPDEQILFRNFDRADGMAQIIERAGMIYTSPVVGDAVWTRDRYIDEQARMVRASRKWLSVNSPWFRPKKSIAAVTLAFLVALRTLAGNPADPVTLKLTDHRDAEKPREILI